MRRSWTRDEDEVVRTFYPSGDFSALLLRLPGRTEAAIRIRAQDIGVASEVHKIKAKVRGCIKDGVGLIQLTKGKYAIVDPEDVDWLTQWRWSYSGHGYARRGATIDGKQVGILMHREILRPPEDMEVDHINGNGLDNRRQNLRLATSRQNKLNMRTTNRSSGYRGVSWNNRDRVWFVRISIDGKARNIGSFRDKEIAARAYDSAARQYHGEFAVLNFPGN